MSDLDLACNCCLARLNPEKPRTMSEWTGLSGRAKNVKRFDWILRYIKTTFTFFSLSGVSIILTRL